MPDVFALTSPYAPSLSSPCTVCEIIAIDDANNIANDSRQLRITAAGNLVVTFSGKPGVARTIPVLANEVLDWRIRRFLTGTTATGFWLY